MQGNRVTSDSDAVSTAKACRLGVEAPRGGPYEDPRKAYGGHLASLTDDLAITKTQLVDF